MVLSFRQKYRLRQFLWIVIAGTGIGFIYTLTEDGWDHIALINGTSAGFVIGVLVAYLELFVFTSSLRKFSFLYLFLLRLAIYFAIALVVTLVLFVVSRAIRYELNLRAVWFTQEFQTYLHNDYPLALIFIFMAITLAVFGLQLASKLGVEDMLGFITGRYRTPRKAERIFMFLELDTEDIFKRSGDLVFHNFLDDIIHQVSDVIKMYKGQIVHYMDDQIVLAWTIKHGLANANCLRTYFHICEEIAQKDTVYRSRYGVTPNVRCALHSGTVVRAEIGEIKSEIAYFGDVLNTTSRIILEGKKLHINILITENVAQQLVIPGDLFKTPVLEFTPRGKTQSIQLYSILSRRA